MKVFSNIGSLNKKNQACSFFSLSSVGVYFYSNSLNSADSNSAIFGLHPSIDSNSEVSNSAMYFLDRNARYSRTYCIQIFKGEPSIYEA